MYPDNSFSTGSEGIPPHVAEQAVEWLVELQEDTVSTEQQQAFQQWYHADGSHQKAWQHIQTVNGRISPLVTPMGSALAQTAVSAENEFSRRHALKVLALLLFVGTTGYGWRRGWHTDAYTDVGEIRTMDLVDGSHLTLNTDSSVNLLTSIKGQHIELLRGEVLVKTLNNHTLPLSLSSAEGYMQTLSGHFMVRQLNGQTRLSVLDGQVQLRLDTGAEAQLTPGQSCLFDRRQIQPIQALLANSDSWQQGMLVASHMRLDQFVAEVSRYRRGVLRCDPAIADLRVSGTYPLTDTDLILQSISRLLNLRLQQITPYWVNLSQA